MTAFRRPWGGAFRLQEFVHQTPEALSTQATDAIRTTILGSSLLGETNLSVQFKGTYGFSITFQRDTCAEVTARFPAFAPFLDAALLPDSNAYLLNPLLVQSGRTVSTHIDQSLEFYGTRVGCPLAVSVLYVQVPPRLTGGELRLYHRGAQVAAVTPRPRTLVRFRGDCMHEVTQVHSEDPSLPAARISLGIEQYRVPPSVLARMPRFEMRNRAGAQS